jgi:hypothetical protein
MRRWWWSAIAGGVALSIAVSYRMAHLALVLGSKNGRWVYEYLYSFSPRSLVVGAIACVVCGAPLMLPAAFVRRREWWLIAFFLIAGASMQLRLRALAPYSIGRMFESDGSNGYYGATRQYPASVLLRSFDRLRPSLTIHPRSNMPGKLALVYALERISIDPAVLAVLVIVLSNAGGVVLYWFVRDLTGDAVAAMVSLALYLFVPAKLFFFPILNTVTPVVVITCLFLWLRALHTGTRSYAVALGAGLFVLTVFEPLPLVTGLVFAGLGVNAIEREQLTWRHLWTHAAIAGVSFIASALLARLTLRFDLAAVFGHLMNDAVAFNDIANRPYGIWVWRNLLDFSIAAGLVQTFLVLAWIIAALGSERASALWRDPVTAFAVSLTATVVVTDMLGVNRGEVVRLWIFLACLAQVPAAVACVRIGNRAAALATLAASLLVGAIGTSMLAFAQP